MAADCVTRVWALAIATAACIGLPSALVYAIVRIAAARRYGAVFALGLVLVFWVTVSAAYYPRVCADLVPWLHFLRRASRRGRGHGVPSLLVPQRSSFVTVDVFPRPRQAPAPAAATRSGGARVRAADDAVPPSPYPYEHQRVPLSPSRKGKAARAAASTAGKHWAADRAGLDGARQEKNGGCSSSASTMAVDRIVVMTGGGQGLRG